MNNGIIETLVEFAQAHADRNTLELLEPNAPEHKQWAVCSFSRVELFDLVCLINQKRIRVKPATITLYEYSCEGVSNWDALDVAGGINHGDGDIYMPTGRSIVSAPIVEGE